MQDSSGHSFASYFKRAVSPLMVLALLHSKKMYGYEISQEINERTNKKLSIAVLYPVLYRLEEQGYIHIVDTVVENGRARNYYSTTAAGDAYLKATYAEFLDLTDTFKKVVEGDSNEQ